MTGVWGDESVFDDVDEAQSILNALMMHYSAMSSPKAESNIELMGGPMMMPSGLQLKRRPNGHSVSGKECCYDPMIGSH
jgi:hypothetical protein